MHFVVDFVKGFGFLGVAWESWLFVGKAKVCECTVAWGRVGCGCGEFGQGVSAVSVVACFGGFSFVACGGGLAGEVVTP